VVQSKDFKERQFNLSGK